MNNKKLQDQTFSGNAEKGKTDPPRYSGFEEEGEYEEPDRDTDYTSIYREDGIEDEEFADTLFEEEDEEGEPESSELDLWATAAEKPADGIEIFFEEEEEEAGEDENNGVGATTPEPAASPQDKPDSESLGMGTFKPEDDWQVDDDEEDSWDDQVGYYDDEPGSAEQAGWPLGLIAVAIIALLLVMAGGYGVIQQRSATQEELRRLQAALATSVSQDDVAQTRASLQEASERNQQLQAIVDALNLENRRLSDTVAGLEAQLETQRNALGTTVAPKGKTESLATTEPVPASEPVAAPSAEPKPTPEPTPVQPVKAATPAPVQQAPAVSDETVTVSTGSGWFVNFASYGVEATAQSWVTKLKPSAGKAIITTGTRNGRTFYRVRVVDLPNRESADRVASELAQKHRLPKLWVGQQE